MKLLILSVGKETSGVFEDARKEFSLRLLRYAPLEMVALPHDVNKEKEGEKLLRYIKPEDYVVLLDERGTELHSEAVAELIENRMIDGVRRMVLVIGGAYGVSLEVHKRANYTWKLSTLVFPHLLVRVIVLEQLYRAMTILRGEKYHHE